jgi:hypothetical protein
MTRYVVIGVRDENGTLTVAGVVPYGTPLLDTDPGPESASRWADDVEADTPDAAAREAVRMCEEEEG